MVALVYAHAFQYLRRYIGIDANRLGGELEMLLNFAEVD